MSDGDDLATILLPDLPGWSGEPADLWLGTRGSVLTRHYRRGRTFARIEVTAGAMAAAVVAGMSLHAEPGARGTPLERYPTHLVPTPNGMVYLLAVILRGGPGDLAGSVLLQVHGKHLRSDDARALVAALDGEAIVAALAGDRPRDAARIAAALAGPPAAPPARPPALWHMGPSLAVMRQASRLQTRQPPQLFIANHDRLGDTLEREAVVPELVVRKPGFAPDLLWCGVQFASARLRKVLALDEDAIRYRPADASGSTPAAQAADYRSFEPRHTADPIDYPATYGVEPERDADGSISLAWKLSVCGPHATPRAMVWLEHFVPPAPLFRDAGGMLLATEVLADRVMRAGLTDVAFQDVSSPEALERLVFRGG